MALEVSQVHIRPLGHDHVDPLGRCCTRKCHRALEAQTVHDALETLVVDEIAVGTIEVDGFGDDV